MRAILGQPIVIENVTGAGAASASVGPRVRLPTVTLSLGQTGSHVMNGAVYALPYDLVSDFEPVGLIATDPTLIVAKSAIPANDLKSLIVWLKANPDKANMGNSGVGSLSHIAGILFQKESGTRLGSVPYPWRCRPCRTWWWQIDMLIADVTTSLAQVGVRRVKAYAVTADARLSSAPDIPTVDEAGLPNFRVSLWHGFGYPSGRRRIS
jgi:tripartite-type tricarboxylate transporter receptor subunit TctC